MANFSGQDAVEAIVTYFARHGSELPDIIFDKLAECISSPDGMNTMNCALESLYSVVDDVGQEGRELLRDLSRFFGKHGFLGKGARGDQINAVVLRILNGGPIDVEGDPEVDPDFVVPELPAEGTTPPEIQEA